MKVLGIDLSLTQTGFVSLDEDGVSFKEEIIRSKPSEKTHIAELERILTIRDKIIALIEDGKDKVEIVALEGMAFAVRGTTSLTQLSGLNYFVREIVYKKGISFIVIAPSTLKKFITGKGNCPKDIMMLETFKRYNVSITNNNVCDAYCLAQCALAVLGKSPLKLIKPQEEVVELLKKQIC